MIECLTWYLTALSAQVGYIMPSKKYVALFKLRITEKVENVSSWEYAN